MKCGWRVLLHHPVDEANESKASRSRLSPHLGILDRLYRSFTCFWVPKKRLVGTKVDLP